MYAFLFMSPHVSFCSWWFLFLLGNILLFDHRKPNGAEAQEYHGRPAE